MCVETEPVIGLSCHRRLADILRSLMPALRRQDHTTSPSASQAHLVKSAARVHRIPCPTFVTIAKRPSVLGRDANDVEVICVKSEPEYFCEEGWTLICDDLPVED